MQNNKFDNQFLENLSDSDINFRTFKKFVQIAYP